MKKTVTVREAGRRGAASRWSETAEKQREEEREATERAGGDVMLAAQRAEVEARQLLALARRLRRRAARGGA